MDSSENALSALDAIDTVAFKVGLKGYNVDEVDEFLERVSVESRQLKDQLHQMRQQLRQASERINQLQSGAVAPTPLTQAPTAPVPTTAPPRVVSSGAGAEQVTAMIVMAQQFIEQAQQEAEAKARELTTAAQERAREIVSEARSRAEDEVNRLNGLKQRLSEDVDTLARQLEIERTRLSGVLAEFSRWIESSLHVGDARPSQGSTPPSTPAGESRVPASPAPADPEPRVATAARPLAPPPAPAPGSNQQTIGQVLNFEQASRDDRS
ncbi:MAG: DivIVA domain-containing protein [Acidimicrobiales bacterium]